MLATEGERLSNLSLRACLLTLAQLLATPAGAGTHTSPLPFVSELVDELLTFTPFP